MYANGINAKLTSSFNNALNARDEVRRMELLGSALIDFQKEFAPKVASILRRHLGRDIAVESHEVSDVFQQLFLKYFSRLKGIRNSIELLTGSAVLAELISRLFGSHKIKGEVKRYADDLFRRERPLLDDESVYTYADSTQSDLFLSDDFLAHRDRVLSDIVNPVLRETAELVFSWTETDASNSESYYFEPFEVVKALVVPDDLRLALQQHLGITQPASIDNRIKHTLLFAKEQGLFCLPDAPLAAIDTLQTILRQLPIIGFYKKLKQQDRDTITAYIKYFLRSAQDAQNRGMTKVVFAYPQYEVFKIEWDVTLISYIVDKCGIGKKAAKARLENLRKFLMPYFEIESLENQYDQRCLA